MTPPPTPPPPRTPEVDRLLTQVADMVDRHAACNDHIGSLIGQLDAYAEIHRIYREMGQSIPPDVEEDYMRAIQGKGPFTL
jgi:hypothetical protein